MKRFAYLLVGLLIVLASHAAAEGPPAFKGHEDTVNCVTVSPDGKTLASSSYDGTVKLWQAATGKLVTSLGGGKGNEVHVIAFAPDGKTIAAAGRDGTVKLWDVATGKERFSLRHGNWVYAVTFSPDGKTLASGGEGETVQLWDPHTGKPLATLKGHTDSVWCLAFTPDGKTLVSGSGDQTVKLWDLATHREAATLKGHTGDVYDVAFAQGGNLLLSASEDETVRLWELPSGKTAGAVRPGQGWVFGLAVQPGGALAASAGGDGTVRLWELTTGKTQAVIKGTGGEVYSVAFSLDGKTLYSGNYDGSVRAWDLAAERAAFSARPDHVAVRPVPRQDETWTTRHGALAGRAAKGNVDVAFLGDSITQGWEESGAEVWNKRFKGLDAANFGINGDRTQHVLWRIGKGTELQGIDPKVIVLLIGTNNAASDTPEQVADGITAVVRELRDQKPDSKILLLGLFPRRPGADNPLRDKIKQINSRIANLDDGKKVHYLDIGAKFLDRDGSLSAEIMPDYLHLSAKGYDTYAGEILPTVRRLLAK